MKSITNIPKAIIAKIIENHTGTLFKPDKIDFITANQIASAVIAYDADIISKRKYIKIIEFNYNNLLEREGFPMPFTPPKRDILVLNIHLFYN